jgi:hypothetical protein
MREDLAGRILEARDLVQIMVIELVVQGLEEGMQLAEIDQPPGVRVDGAFDGELDAETVAVEPKAFVRFGQSRQAVSRFESKLVDEPNVHRGGL